MNKEDTDQRPLNFIEEIMEEDIVSGKYGGKVHTRFPPEPNGYLHIGHSKAICLNFGIAERYGGKTNLRFDDTNPATEETIYVENIKKDIRWLGYDWEDREYYASDYFPALYEMALQLIRKGLAYVDDSTSEEIADIKGTPTVPGKNSPFRDRSMEENMELFIRMKEGEFPDGSRVLRAKIDMSSPNMHMRDPIMYRIKRETHHRTGDEWCIYPMYDFAHGQSDSLEEITHSLCSLEFRHHRPLYDWFIEKLEIYPSRQIEFSRLNLSYTIMSKRKLLKLVKNQSVSGWDDPRMPTLAGMRRRGYTPEAIRDFADRVGLTKRENIIDVSLLEYCVREHLNRICPRVMVVLDPVKVIIRNYPDEKVELLEAENNPEDESQGSRELSFSRELFIEREDFMTDPPKKYFRMAPGRNVRLKNAYILHCEEFTADENGRVKDIYCSYYPDSRSGQDTSGIKAKGTLHWVSVIHAVKTEVRLYDRLFTDENPDGHEDKEFTEFLNPASLVTVSDAFMEPGMKSLKHEDKVQFMRLGYFCVDGDSTSEKLVFNRTVELKDSWTKLSIND